VPFFFCLFFHSFGCFVKFAKPDGTAVCKGYNSNYYTVPIFVLYCAERLLREYRARQGTKLSKVIFHPGNTMELRIEKPSFLYQPGQYLFMNVPAVSKFQWHPFTISSCPEEGFVSVHIRILGDWTKQVAEVMGCLNDSKTPGKIPRVMIDGPYGAPAEDLKNYKIALLVGAGIGVTPAASLLKSVWYEYYRKAPIALKKLYFIWITRDADNISWFQSLLSSLEDTVPADMLEIHTYVSGKQSLDDIHNLCINADSALDPMTELTTRCHYGRPNWSDIYKNVRSNCSVRADEGKLTVGVFFCGPAPMAKALEDECKNCSDDQVEFEMRKEKF
jgi:NADPH oxidase 1